MNPALSASPRPIYHGIRDDSLGDIPVAEENFPTHLLHAFLFTPEGPDVALVGGNDFQRLFGSDALNLNGKYTTHQTALAQKVLAEGSKIVAQRVRPQGAKKANMRIGIEVTKGLVDQDEYDREADGSVKLDESGNYLTTGSTVQAYLARWSVEEIDPDVAGFAEAQVRDGTDIVIDSTDHETSFYPVMDVEASFWGERGTLKGIRVWAPSGMSLNKDLVRENKAFEYVVQMVERPDEDSQPRVISTLRGTSDVSFMLKPGAFNETLQRELHADEVILDSYRDLESSVPTYGPFNKLHVYQDEIEEISRKLYHNEYQTRSQISSDLVSGWPEVDPSGDPQTDSGTKKGAYLINIFSAHDEQGDPYETFRIRSGSGSVRFNSDSTYYPKGGSDGVLDDGYDAKINELNTKVAEICEFYNQPGVGSEDDDGNTESDHVFVDTAMWPQSAIYDSGFSVDTKNKIFQVLRHRKDIAVLISTQDVSQEQNDSETESSLAIALNTAAEAFPESEVYGTPVARAAIVGHSGWLVNSPYRYLLPLTVDLATKCAQYMGRSNGVWREGRGFDQAPYNQVGMFKDVNLSWKPANVYENDWDNGMIFVQNFDRRSLFYPGLQTVHPNHTSVLNSIMNMFICIETQKVAERTWRRLTGNAKLTRDQFVDRSDTFISDNLEGRFDNRVIVVPRTYFTDVDEELGYSWSTDITLYMNNMRTVGTYTIITDRRANFEG